MLRCSEMMQALSNQPLSNQPGREVELKLAVPEAALGRLLSHARFAADGVPGLEPRRQVTTYFDTADRALWRADVSLRVRRNGERRVQTLKADKKAGLAADRAEWEWPVEHDTPDLGLLATTPVAARLQAGLDLAPVVVTEIERRVRVLTLDGGTVVEVAIDTGEIIAGNRRAPVRELELELRSGDPAPLFRLALELHAAVAMSIESQSKATRGYRLLSGAAATARKADAIALPAGATGAAALRRILTATLGHLLANQPAALAGDAQGVHQMRIAIRRLRAALALFRPLLDPLAVASFQAELGGIGRCFGEARDWDVFELRTLPWMARAEAPRAEAPRAEAKQAEAKQAEAKQAEAKQAEAKQSGAKQGRAKQGGAPTGGARNGAATVGGATAGDEVLRRPARTRREAAHRRVIEEVRSARFTSLLLGLAAWAEQPDLLGAAASGRPIEALFPALLDRLAHTVEQRGRGVGEGSDAQRHAFRKALNKLFHGVDFLRGVLPAEAVWAYLRTCKRLLRALGESNDAVTAMHLANDLMADASADGATAAGATAGGARASGATAGETRAGGARAGGTRASGATAGEARAGGARAGGARAGGARAGGTMVPGVTAPWVTVGGATAGGAAAGAARVDEAPVGLASASGASAGLAPSVGLLERLLRRRRGEGLWEFAKRWNAFQAAPRIWAPNGGRTIGTRSLPGAGMPRPTP